MRYQALSQKPWIHPQVKTAKNSLHCAQGDTERVQEMPMGLWCVLWGKARGTAVLDGETREPWDCLGKHPGRRHSRCRGPGTEQAKLRHLPAFTAYGGLVGGTHKWSSAALCGLWEDRGHRYPLEEQGEWQGPLFTFFLCPGTLFPSLGTEGPEYTESQGWEKSENESVCCWVLSDSLWPHGL